MDRYPFGSSTKVGKIHVPTFSPCFYVENKLVAAFYPWFLQLANELSRRAWSLEK